MDNQSVSKLNLPACGLKIRRDADSRRGGDEVYCILRRQWVALTPEEWVRQHFVHFLISDRSFPASLMANEVSLKLNGTSRRCDTLVYGRNLQPLMLVEYKAPNVPITQRVFDQIARYNIVVGAPYLVVSNGLNHYCCRYGADGYAFIADIPTYDGLLSE